jgi:endonuclease/exonuclease/phosphatase family metal-dependent hydrolase
LLILLLSATLLCGIFAGCKDHSLPASAAAAQFGRVETLSVMSWNVEALFDLVADGGEFPEYKPDQFNWNYDRYQRKLENLSAVIAAAGVDVVALVEVENERALADLQKKLSQRGRKYPYCAIGSRPNPTNTKPAILSRFPITSSNGIGLPKMEKFHTRNILEADLAVGAAGLKVFALHWPSKQHPESQRISAAQVLARRLAQLPAGTDFIIAGDFNTDYDEAEKVFTVTADSRDATVGMQHILHTVQSRPGQVVDYVTEDELRGQAALPQLYDPWLELPFEQRFCYIHKGRNSTLDHILLPAALYDSLGWSYADNSFRVMTWNGRLLRNGAPYRWQVRRTARGLLHTGEGYSDHLPLVVKLRRGPFIPAAVTTPAPPRPPAAAAVGTGLGFETGFEGWVPTDQRLRLSLDSSKAAAGRFSLRLEGLTADNVTAARVVLVPGSFNLSAGRYLSLDVAGNGKWALRLRRDKDAAWQYHFWKDGRLTAAARPKYVPYQSSSWRHLRLALPPAASASAPVELELRIGKDVPARLWLDNVAISR